jgi:hypothetical protein
MGAQGGSSVKKTENHWIAKDARNGTWQAAEGAGDQLESVVSELLDAEIGSTDAAGGAAADLAARNGGSQVPGRTLREEEIEALLERMVFSEQAFLKYSH